MNPCDRATADLNPPLAVFAYMLADTSAIYVSAPINSGWRFLSWYDQVGRSLTPYPEQYSAAHSRDVVRPNCDHVRDAVTAIRSQESPKPVIDPMAFEFSGWNQDDYRCFWGKVIERFAHKVIFLDGWEASTGCVHEFRIAKQSNVPVFNERGHPIRLDEAIKRIRKAAEELNRLSLEDLVFQSSLSDLESLKELSLNETGVRS